jgi:hypothetical protein
MIEGYDVPADVKIVATQGSASAIESQMGSNKQCDGTSIPEQ